MEFAVCPASPPRKDWRARGAVRYPVKLPVTLLSSGRELKAVTEDLSASGVLFRLPESLPLGQEVEFLLEIPAGLLDFSHTAAVHCRGRIVRTFWKGGSPWAAAVIDEYRFQ
ncbi:MAG TPA: PilZ domain-containing protein [Acidobacteriaceae bacterium]|nr:PilZ domain-containing protein [Acidobacteriaceae bacterium]